MKEAQLQHGLRHADYQRYRHEMNEIIHEFVIWLIMGVLLLEGWTCVTQKSTSGLQGLLHAEDTPSSQSAKVRSR